VPTPGDSVEVVVVASAAAPAEGDGDGEGSEGLAGRDALVLGERDAFASWEIGGAVAASVYQRKSIPLEQ
jgi:hypothetical protein